MERATKNHFERTSLRDEHIHRYQLAARFVHGIVVDCACGIGYGSEIITRDGLVNSYLGIDPSKDAIQYAQDNYSGNRTHFECGTLESNSCPSSSVDCFLMFETLEHTQNPSAALTNVRCCLKPDGLLIGSIPSAEYDSLCESTYGPNPFHLQRFTKEQIVQLLCTHFDDVQIFSMEFVLGSLVRSINQDSRNDAEILSSSKNENFAIMGSIVFFAGSKNVVSLVKNEFGASTKFFQSISKAVLDREEIIPIREAMASMEAMIRERDKLILTAQQKPWRKIRSSMRRLIKGSIIKTNRDLFPELSTTYFYFIHKLHDTLVEQGVKKVYFLSREGQALKQMFDMYCEKIGSPITSYYLEVSRRSTFLPSLKTLSEENFETLFRQYRDISLLEFLSSLGLDKYIKILTQAIGLKECTQIGREKDFPNSLIFTSLKELPLFQKIYKSERVNRRKAFIDYLSTLSGGTIPAKLVIVDVGWKGTIQDNLFAMLCNKGDTVVHAITGYYVGLAQNGPANSNNEKLGLLFSCVNGIISQNYRIFNENRALFEILLAADHGSIASYEIGIDGKAQPIRDKFEEAEMLATQVFPVARQILTRYKVHLSKLSLLDKTDTPSFKDVVRAHSRMVFNPTPAERAWFSSVFHVENFGVFEHSDFNDPTSQTNFFARLRFLKQLLLKRNRSILGFWPWKTLYERVNPVLAIIYAIIRRIQH